MALTLDEARQRAGVLSAVSYDLHLDLTGTDVFRSRTTVRFASSAAETFLELRGATSVAMRVNGEPVPEPAYDGRRLPLTGLLTGGPDEPNVVEVDATIPYTTDGDGMHAFTDPADGERYVSAYLGMDVAQRVLACFDQNDLKATFTVSVDADPGWTVLANGRVTRADGGTWEFATTPPIPPALLVVCAGPWHSVTWEHAAPSGDPLPFGWHARRSLAAELDRDADELRRTTEACFDHFAAIFDEPYAFDSYDQIFVPGLNWGAQEMPGCVTYRDELLPRGAITDHARATRATIIAHEMSHMWFGDSMTMTWWEDTWLQESFADYMGYRVAEDGAGFPGALVDFEVGRKPWGYDADARRSTHPVAPLAEDVPDVDAAAANFDSISYAKGNACLRQLAAWLGDEEFLAGINVHLSRFRLANATFDDFVDSLDSVSSRDVRGWVEVWLRRPGYDTIHVERDGDVPVLRRDGIRPHAFTVAAFAEAAGAPGSPGGLVPTGRRRVELTDDAVALPDCVGLVVVPDAAAETFAAVRPDPRSWEALARGLSGIEDPVVRAVVWSTAFRLVWDRSLSVDDYLALVGTQLPAEPHPAIVEAVLLRSRRSVVPARVPADEAASAIGRIAAAAATGLAESAGDEQRALAFAAALAGTAPDPELLRRWLADDSPAAGLPLLPSVRWRVLARLAELGAADEALIRTELDRDRTIDAELGAARALAARPTEEAKSWAWAALSTDADVSNRRFSALADGLWVPEQAELLRPYVAAYLAEGPRLARRGQAFAGVVGQAFPALALDGDQLGLLREALAGDVPFILRRSWEDRLDDRA